MEFLTKTSIVHADQCQYGAEVAHGSLKGVRIKKPTELLRNAPSVLKMLSRRAKAGQASTLDA